MIYLILGIPLTLLLLVDLGSLFTRFIKFMSAFITDLYRAGYFDLVLSSIKLGLLKLVGKKSTGKDKSSKKEEDLDQEEKVDINVYEIGLNCYKNNDDAFDMPLGFLFSFIFGNGRFFLSSF